VRRGLLWCLVAFWVAFCGEAWAAVGLGTPCSVSATAVSTLSFSCTASGSDRLVTAHLTLMIDPPTTLDAITYGGSAMALIDTQTLGGIGQVFLHRLLAPATGPQTFQVDFTNFVQDVAAGILPFTGVHQVTPIGTAAKTTTSGTSISVNVSSAPDELVTDTVLICDAAGGAAGGGQTQHWALLSGAARGSTKTGSSTATMSWSWTNSDCAAMVAAPIKPSAVASITFFERRR
jgi:hypothetical protein